MWAEHRKQTILKKPQLVGFQVFFYNIYLLYKNEGWRNKFILSPGYGLTAMDEPQNLASEVQELYLSIPKDLMEGTPCEAKDMV